MSLTIGKDDKTYTAWRTKTELARVVGICHHLHCKQGLSIRGVKRKLFDYHCRRSVGAISQYLSRYECDICAARPAQPPSSVRPEVIAWG